MYIGQFVPLMAQVAETHIDTYNFCKLAYNTKFTNVHKSAENDATA